MKALVGHCLALDGVKAGGWIKRAGRGGQQVNGPRAGENGEALLTRAAEEPPCNSS